MGSILLLHYLTTEFRLFKSFTVVIKPFLDLITVLRMITLANHSTDTTQHPPIALKQVLLISNDIDNVHILSTDFKTTGRCPLKAYHVCFKVKCNSLFGWICGHRVAKTLTGVRSSGVKMGELSLLSLIPLPRSKSQIFTGEICKKQINRKADQKPLLKMTIHNWQAHLSVYCLPENLK